MSVMIYLPYLYVHKRRNLSILCFLWQLKFFLNLIPTGYLGGKCLKVLVKDTLVFFFFQFESLLTWKNFSRVNIQCKSSSVSELFLCHLLFLHWLLDSRVAVTVERGPFHEDRAAAHTATPWCWPPETGEARAWWLQTAVEHIGTLWAWIRSDMQRRTGPPSAGSQALSTAFREPWQSWGLSSRGSGAGVLAWNVCTSGQLVNVELYIWAIQSRRDLRARW